MGKFLLATLCVVLIGLPNKKFESLELPWFKFKERIEESEKIAAEELAKSRKKEVNRWDVLYAVSTDEFIYDSMVTHVHNSHYFDQPKVTGEVVEILSKFIDHFEVVGYVGVIGRQLDLYAMQTLGEQSAVVVQEVYDSRIKKLNDKHTAFAVPLYYRGPQDPDFTIIYVYAKAGSTLTEEDQLLVLSIWEVVKCSRSRSLTVLFSPSLS